MVLTFTGWLINFIFSRVSNFVIFLFFSWNRWGRVGETGSNNGLEYHSDVNSAIKSFEKKFKDKTKNDWKNKDNFVPVAGKYTLLEMDCGDEEEETQIVLNVYEFYFKYEQFYLTRHLIFKSIDCKEYQPSKLDAATQELMDLIFDRDMFNNQMKKFEIGKN